MSDLRSPATRRGARPRAATGLFRAFWRWHFYAAFLVVPVLLLMAVTGLVYLFRFQLEPALHPDLMRVDRSADVAQPYAAQLASVEAAYPELTVLAMAEPREPGRSTVFNATAPDGTARDVYVDPWTAHVQGALDPDRTLSGYAVRLHAELMAGRWGDLVIELAACWAIVMAVTGYYLFVRGRLARRRRRGSGTPGSRLRSRHAAVGAATGAGLLLLLVSGLPWTGFWGEQLQRLATSQGSSLWSLDPGASSSPASTLDESLPHSHAQDVPWGLGNTSRPSSSSEATNVANLDTAVTVAAREGLRHPMTVLLPADESGVYSVLGDAFHDPSRERTVHVDRYGGQVVTAYGFEDYPVPAKVVAQGIGLHEGRSLGLWSFWGAALMCCAVVFSCVSGPLMWWRRRPRGSASLGAPRGRLPLRDTPWLLVVLVGLGVLLPVFGASLLIVLALDRWVLPRVPVLAGLFDR